ncbi:MAG TPA: NAD(P)H-dependent oxidoreductase [Dongiaceae bacterium]|jgi:NAD(P)H dehydrogenase (quinone)
MHLLIVFAHPRCESFTGAVLDSLLAGFREAGEHSVEIADLYRENFESRFQPEDYAQFRGETMPEEVRGEQARFDRCDAVAFVFPVWWWSFPAVLKGWIDRVFCEGWAYSFEPGISRGRLKDRPTLLVGIAGSRESTYNKYGYGEAMRVQIDIGILGYCGLRDVETHILFDVEQSPENRGRYLSEARDIGRKFLSPERQRRVPTLGSERPA